MRPGPGLAPQGRPDTLTCVLRVFAIFGGVVPRMQAYLHPENRTGCRLVLSLSTSRPVCNVQVRIYVIAVVKVDPKAISRFLLQTLKHDIFAFLQTLVRAVEACTACLKRTEAL